MIWEDKYRLRISVIDEQHKTLIAMISELEIVKDNLNEDTFSRVKKELLDYTCFHFETEEYMMEQAGYAKLDDHKKNHDSFKKEIDLLISQPLSKKLIDEVTEFLYDWVKEHILEVDKDYCEAISKIF